MYDIRDHVSWERFQELASRSVSGAYEGEVRRVEVCIDGGRRRLEVQLPDKTLTFWTDDVPQSAIQVGMEEAACR